MEKFEQQRRQARDPGRGRRGARAYAAVSTSWSSSPPARARSRGCSSATPTRSPYEAPQRALALTYVHRADAARRSTRRVALQPDPGRRRVLRLPGADHHGPVRDHGVRRASRAGRWTAGATSRPRPSTWSVPSGSWRRSCRGRPSGAERRAHRRRTAFWPGASRRPCESRSADCPPVRPVLGLADVVMLNDPITGQGSNNASKARPGTSHSILEHGDRPFDREFMERTFEGVLDRYGQYVTTWTNALLSPPPQHVLDLFGAADESERDRAALRQRLRRRPRLLRVVHGSREGEELHGAGRGLGALAPDRDRRRRALGPPARARAARRRLRGHGRLEPLARGDRLRPGALQPVHVRDARCRPSRRSASTCGGRRARPWRESRSPSPTARAASRSSGPRSWTGRPGRWTSA